MDDALLVRGFERFGDLASDRQSLNDSQRPGREPIGEGRTFARTSPASSRPYMAALSGWFSDASSASR